MWKEVGTQSHGCGFLWTVPLTYLDPLVHPLLLQVTISVLMALSRFGVQAMWPWHAMKVCPPPAP